MTRWCREGEDVTSSPVVAVVVERARAFGDGGATVVWRIVSGPPAAVVVVCATVAAVVVVVVAEGKIASAGGALGSWSLGVDGTESSSSSSSVPSNETVASFESPRGAVVESFESDSIVDGRGNIDASNPQVAHWNVFELPGGGGGVRVSNTFCSRREMRSKSYLRARRLRSATGAFKDPTASLGWGDVRAWSQ